MRLLIGVLALALCLTAFNPPARAAEKFVTIGTAGITGVYYPAGGAICRLVNRGRKEHGIRCSVESTGGSIDNLANIYSRDLDFGIVQSDMQYQAYNSAGIFTDLPRFDKLRSVFSLHSEAFTIIVREDSGIRTFDGLKGKRVSVGGSGSGNRATMEELMKFKGWTASAIHETEEIKPQEQGRSLCDNKIDAVIYAAGHPNGAVQEVTSLCKTRILSIEDEVITSMVKNNPYYGVATIPGGMYNNNPSDIRTFGVKATLVTSADEDEEVVYQLVKAVFNNFDNFKTLHPVFSTLDINKMITEGNTAPIHPGALRYFKEKGLYKEPVHAQ